MEKYCRYRECGKGIDLREALYAEELSGYVCNPICRSLAGLEVASLIPDLQEKGVDFVVDIAGNLVSLKSLKIRTRK